MAEPILYSFRRCPYAMRARLALRISGRVCELREVKLSAKPQTLLDASPKGTVPVLVLPDGAVIDESLDIMLWALGQNDPEGWLSRHDAALIEVNDGSFKHHLDRYKYPARYGSDPFEHRAAAAELLQPLERRLTGASNLSGEQRGITDMAIFPFIRQFAATDREWFATQPFPRLNSWLDRHTADDLFIGIMTRAVPWQFGGEPVWFNFPAIKS